MFENTRVLAVVRLPDETFKPNKINVRSSVLVMEKRDKPDPDLDEDYDVTFIDIASLGYYGSGEPIRGFDLSKLLLEVEEAALDSSRGTVRSGYSWTAFDVPLSNFKSDQSFRLDLKYWNPDAIELVDAIKSGGAVTIDEINLLETKRGSRVC